MKSLKIWLISHKYRTICLGILAWIFLPAYTSSAAAITAGPWLQAATETSIVIMWETDRQQSGTVDCGRSASYGQTVASKSKRVPATSVSGDTSAILHEVKLTQLRPDTKYHYRVRTGNAQSADHFFTTNASRGPWRCIHTSSPNAYVQVKSKEALASIIAAAPDCVVISGDVSNNATNKDYRRFFSRGRDLVANTVLYTVQGNHDDRAWSTYDDWVHNDVSNGFNERFYSFDIGPAHFVAINDSARQADFPADWFARNLARSQATWNIVFMNGNFRKHGWLQRLLKASKDHIDVFLISGSGNQYVNAQGILQVESGGADKVYHVLDITETSFRATLYRRNGAKKGSKAIWKPGRKPPIEDEPPVANAPPIARITATPVTGIAPLEVTFDGTRSTDADGRIVSYDWDLDDGNTAIGDVVHYVYDDTGAYTITLTVTDDEGTTHTATTTIRVTAATGDGAVETVHPVADGYVYEYQPKKNFAKQVKLLIRDGRKDRRTYLKFDLRHMAATRAMRAYLKVYANYAAGTVDVRAVSVADDDWSEANLTWN